MLFKKLPAVDVTKPFIEYEPPKDADEDLVEAGLFAPPITREDADHLIKYMLFLEQEVENIVKIASHEIAKRTKKLIQLKTYQLPHIKPICTKFMKRKKDGTYSPKYYTTADLSARLFFRKTGGWKCNDPIKYTQFINEMKPEDFKNLGGEMVRKLDWRLRDSLAKEGVYFAGMEFSEEDQLGKINVGVDKAISQSKMKESLSAALRQTTNFLEEEESDQ